MSTILQQKGVEFKKNPAYFNCKQYFANNAHFTGKVIEQKTPHQITAVAYFVRGKQRMGIIRG